MSRENVDPLIRAAIEERRLLRFWYRGKERTLEPHDYGVHKGVVKLLAYQVAGESSEKLPNWRWIEIGLASQMEMLNQTFAGGRGAKSSQNHKWDKLFIRVRPAEVEGATATV